MFAKVSQATSWVDYLLYFLIVFARCLALFNGDPVYPLHHGKMRR
jgi:hypothetical protein